MRAIILVGGLGTRLRPLTLDRPKALLPVLNRPFLSYQLDLLSRAGVRDVMLAAAKATRPWQRDFARIAPKGMRIHFAFEPAPLGTGGAIRFAFDALEKKRGRSDEPHLVFNGDVFFDLDPAAMLAFHRRSRSGGTIALIPVDDPSRFGVVECDPAGRVRRFLEKPTNYRGAARVNAGAYLLEPALLRTIEAGRALSVEKDVYPRVLAGKGRLFGFAMKGYWNDIGTHGTYLSAHRDLLSGRTRWTPRGLLRKRAALAAGVTMAKDARITGFLSAAKGVRIGSGSSLTDCVLLEGAVIGQNVTAEGAIVGPDAVIGDNAVLRPGVVLGRGSRVAPHSKL